MSGRVKWVNHPRHGWLVDDVPLFEARWSGSEDPALWELRVVGVADDEGLTLYDMHGVSSGFLGKTYSSAPYVPLTTAARDLLAALRAEVES